MTPPLEKHIAVIGAGVIGASWAACFLAHGHHVTVTDPSEGAAGRLHRFVSAAWPSLRQLGVTSTATPENLSFAPTIAEAVTTATFIQENGPERLAAKRAILSEIEAAASPTAIIASSSSGLLISEIQQGARHPERILIGHPFNPPHLLPLVEIVPGPATSPEATAAALSFYNSLGKKPIVLTREIPGHIANRLQVALWREAFALVTRGIATVSDIDTAIAHGPGLRWALLGPFLNLHASGGAGGITHNLQHLGPAMRAWSADLAPYPETDDYIAPIAAGVAEELQDHDFEETLRERDELLVKLLALKRDARELP